MLDPKHRSTIVTAASVLLLVSWVVWWGEALVRMRLFGAERTWLHYPMLGADFWSQSDYAARLWAAGKDPYENRVHLFHYPPIVIRLFLWTPFFPMRVALGIWTGVLTVTIAVAAWMASRVRATLGIEPVPGLLAVVASLYSFPSVFAVERSNFDLITLITMLIALPLMKRKSPIADFVAGCLLSVGPWVKIYPAFLGIALVVLRRWYTVAGFVVMGVAIGLAAPEETMRSFDVLRQAIANVKLLNDADWATYYPWVHSLSAAWSKLMISAPQAPFFDVLVRVPDMVAACAFVSPLLVWVCIRVYRSVGNERLAYPLMLWVVALASFVPQIANDYSLVFLPLSVIALWSRKDSFLVHAGIGVLLLWWQPFALPIPGSALLVVKLVGLAAVGFSLMQRARELEAVGDAAPASKAVDQRAGLVGAG